MKKIIYIIISLFLLTHSSYALTNTEQQEYKQEFINLYEKFDNNLNNYSNNKQKFVLENISMRLDILLTTNLSEKNKFIINLFKININKKLEKLYDIPSNNDDHTNENNLEE
jgi:hypothetical protein